jgi:perosamine synthetase
MYVIQVPHQQRDKIANQLREAGIQCDMSFAPLHMMGPFREMFGYQPGAFPVAEELGRSSLALPFASTMTEERVDAICQAVRNAV